MVIIQNLKIVFIWQSKFGTFSGKLVSFWGLRPQTRPPPGLCPWTPLGDSVPQTPSDLLPPGKIPSYATGVIHQAGCILVTIPARVGVHFGPWSLRTFKKERSDQGPKWILAVPIVNEHSAR